MTSHQQRVRDEKADLDFKIANLRAFIGIDDFAALHQFEQERLRRQLMYMAGYANVLEERIKAFPRD